MKPVTVQRVSKDGLERLAPTIEALAELEGMSAHKATARREHSPDHRHLPMASLERGPRRQGGAARLADPALRRQHPGVTTASARPAALAKALADINEYDRGRYEVLREAIADFHGVGLDQVSLGAGSDEFIVLLAALFAENGTVADGAGRFIFHVPLRRGHGGSAPHRRSGPG